ncbi:alkaline phosphatase family protein [Chitinophaga ginsengisoli]|uniref:Type I phosphodiesterase/nucleotide pyrophosphatase n=1 Tax=Chitinophaga ginsengisoli TaxID=363837 RepID=A0A2P8G2H9_9BACT|nr:alkaline phosphatase family protein [Chitinophaga ginsengisoli]PSL28182.1 type I phosphodiesterase/nucleotide pyrophosphatase [Chitinophaga ginsengisoli]
MKSLRPLLVTLFAGISISSAQSLKPRLIVGLVVDQMRWEYLYKFNSRFGPDGFKRLMDSGFNCNNTHLNFYPSHDGPGYASIFTGTVPSIHGIPANSWYDKNIRSEVYCVEDETVRNIGSDRFAGSSPRRLEVNTIGDELRLFTNHQSKVFAISLMDRAAVLSAGHSGNAYWLDGGSGNFISSTFYLARLPSWVEAFNSRQYVDSICKAGWDLLYPRSTYIYSNDGGSLYKGTPFGKTALSFPYDLSSFASVRRNVFSYTPFGNTILIDFATKLISNEKLGSGDTPDLLTIAFSSTDYIGHAFNPNSIELEDTYLRLDKEIGSFLRHLDELYGKDGYLVFLTSDHGVANNFGYLKDMNINSGEVKMNEIILNTEKYLKSTFGDLNWIRTFNYPMIHLNDSSIITTGIDRKAITEQIKKNIEQYDGVLKVLDLTSISDELLEASLKTKTINGIFSKLSGDMIIILKPNYYETFSRTGTTHGSLFSYDTHIPLLWYGCGIKSQKDYSEINITDIAPTISAILNIPEPNGSTGHIIKDLLININKK